MEHIQYIRLQIKVSLSKNENKKYHHELSLKQLWYEKTKDLFSFDKKTRNKESYLPSSQISAKAFEENPQFEDLNFDYKRYYFPQSLQD